MKNNNLTLWPLSFIVTSTKATPYQATSPAQSLLRISSSHPPQPRSYPDTHPQTRHRKIQPSHPQGTCTRPYPNRPSQTRVLLVLSHLPVSGPDLPHPPKQILAVSLPNTSTAQPQDCPPPRKTRRTTPDCCGATANPRCDWVIGHSPLIQTKPFYEQAVSTAAASFGNCPYFFRSHPLEVGQAGSASLEDHEFVKLVLIAGTAHLDKIPPSGHQTSYRTRTSR